MKLFRVDVVFDYEDFSTTRTYLKVGITERQVEDEMFDNLKNQPNYSHLLGLTIEEIKNVDGYDVILK